LALVTIGAKSTSYQKAKGIIDDDPIEADALLAQVVADSSDAKIQRAALYELFYLRLKLGRYAEAFSLALTKTMKKKLTEAVSPFLGLDEKAGGRFIAMLRSACHSDATTIAEFIAAKNYRATAYDFAIRALRACSRPEVAQEILSHREPGFASKKSIQLHLMAIRYALEDGDDQTAETLVAELNGANSEILLNDQELAANLTLIEARRSSRAADAEAVKTRCGQIGKGEKLKTQRRACKAILAYALALTEQYAAGFETIKQITVEDHEVDLRLLRMALKVGAQKAPAAKLVAFQKRASYKYAPKSLKELADKVLAQK